MVKYYFELAKPRIIFANLILLVGGFFFNTNHNNFSINTLFFSCLATSLMIGSASIFNNIIDFDIDKKMDRTKNRVLVKSLLSFFNAKICAIIFFFTSIIIFLIKINILCCILSLIGFFIYVVVYTFYLKRSSVHSVIFGSFAGCIPSAIGYCSVSNCMDLKIILLCISVVLWQIPHSYSIFMLYLNDYKKANLPIITIKKGKIRTLKEIIFYIFCFFISTIFIYQYKYINILFFIILLVLNILWFFISIVSFFYFFNIFLLRLLFYYSIVLIMIFNIMLIFFSI